MKKMERDIGMRSVEKNEMAKQKIQAARPGPNGPELGHRIGPPCDAARPEWVVSERWGPETVHDG